MKIPEFDGPIDVFLLGALAGACVLIGVFLIAHIAMV